MRCRVTGRRLAGFAGRAAIQRKMAKTSRESLDDAGKGGERPQIFSQEGQKDKRRERGAPGQAHDCVALYVVGDGALWGAFRCNAGPDRRCAPEPSALPPFL